MWRLHRISGTNRYVFVARNFYGDGGAFYYKITREDFWGKK